MGNDSGSDSGVDDGIHDIASVIKEFADQPIWYGGQRHPGEAPAIAVRNPANEDVLSDLASASTEQVDAALAAARDAQYAWNRSGPSARSTLLHDMAKVLRDNAEVLAEVVMAESGKTWEMSHADVEVGAVMLDLNAEWALRIEGEILPSDTPTEEITIRREPLGVVVAICPWNWALTIACRKIGPALVTGNTVVVKPSEVPPLSTVLAMKLWHENLEIPPGVLNLVTGGGEVGKALVTNPISAMVSFTGHRDTGKRIMETASGTLTRVALELGSKAPAIVLKDADLDKAVPTLVQSRFWCAGEFCNATERILVERPIVDEFIKRYTAAVSELKVGDPRENPDFGPLANGAHYEKVDGAVQKARSEGATVATGGGRPEGADFEKGYWYAPTVITDVTEDMSIMRDETFGPVVPVLAVDSAEHAIEIANSSRYGLAAYLWTSSYASAMTVSRDLEVGEVFINRGSGEALHAHHGGHKESGYGGEDGKHGMVKYTQLKVVYHNW
ncbi:lactaldehyde dehydrogenase / glycolaldehyde dehydrogenase [Jatrophihabitans endophyticus]|uniref:Lactaldehyde dehydrogenase / glycolaldehyde dehydrogenase n=1 Tax=Jatrophihabitans endophyticus TaxID=1206085 RepID=A0A1M5PZ02_9ACTN|nr:aldehyde dehydrogenase family protein [Jatrophihabitans endophyticus]SHH07237.1 lactaldehyde dehydrogenase / glycolaldehyde dehydrogenase [Jatrophihabitans endophyticus]